MFTYLDYARYGIEKLAGLARLSKTVCETRDKFLRYPQDMIDYYNSVAKIIYGSSSVTDVTSVGDKNGFRAQSTAKVGEIFKGLSNYEVPLFMRRTSYTYRPILTGLNIYLNGYIEDKKRMKIETCMVHTYTGDYLITIGYVPQISYIVFCQALRVGTTNGLIQHAYINSTYEVIGMGMFSSGFVSVERVTPMSIAIRIYSFTGDERMTVIRNTSSGKFLVSPAFTLTAQQTDFLYFQTVCKDLDESTLQGETVGVIYKGSAQVWNSYSEFEKNHTDFVAGSQYLGDPTVLNIWNGNTYIPAALEIAVNDATAIALMYILSQDIMAEINAA